jgi:hypothetical protein
VDLNAHQGPWKRWKISRAKIADGASLHSYLMCRPSWPIAAGRDAGSDAALKFSQNLVAILREAKPDRQTTAGKRRANMTGKP